MKPKFKYSREMYSPRVNIKFLETDEFGYQIYEYSVNGKTYKYSIPAVTYTPSVTYVTAPYMPIYSTYATYDDTISTTITTNTYTL